MAMPDQRTEAGPDVADEGPAVPDLPAREPRVDTGAVPPVRLTAPVVPEVPPEDEPVVGAPDYYGAEDLLVGTDDLLDVLDEPADTTGEYEVVDAPRHGRLPRGRVKARKVHRVIRYVSPWSVFKVSLLFSLCLWMIVSIGGVILWQVALASGTVTQFEEFLATLFAEESFTLDGRQMFRATATAGVIIVFAGTAFAVLMALLFNVISDVTGGIRLTVLELESARREVRRSSLERMAAREERRRGGASSTRR